MQANIYLWHARRRHLLLFTLQSDFHVSGKKNICTHTCKYPKESPAGRLAANRNRVAADTSSGGNSKQQRIKTERFLHSAPAGWSNTHQTVPPPFGVLVHVRVHVCILDWGDVSGLHCGRQHCMFDTASPFLSGGPAYLPACLPASPDTLLTEIGAPRRGPGSCQRPTSCSKWQEQAVGCQRYSTPPPLLPLPPLPLILKEVTGVIIGQGVQFSDSCRFKAQTHKSKKNK